MSFNVSVLGKVFYVTPWMVYNTHADTDSNFALNEFEPNIQHRMADAPVPDLDSKNDENVGDEYAGNEQTGDIVEGNKVAVIEYHPEMSIAGSHEDDFTGVFPSYLSWVGIVGTGLAARYGYAQRHTVKNALRRAFGSS